MIPRTLAVALGVVAQLTLTASAAWAQDVFGTAASPPVLQGATNGTIGPVGGYYLAFDTVDNDPSYAQTRLQKLGWTGRAFEVREPDEEELSGGFDDFMDARPPAYSDLLTAAEEDAFSGTKVVKHVWSWEDDWGQIKMVRQTGKPNSDRVEELDYWAYRRRVQVKQERQWDWRTVSPNVKTIKIVFYTKPYPEDIERALRELKIVDGTVITLLPPTFCTGEGLPTLDGVLKDIEDVDHQNNPLKLMHLVQVGGATTEANGTTRKLPQIKIYEESTKAEAYKSLYELAQSLTDDPVKVGIYKGAQACAHGNWDKAWACFEGVNDIAKDNPDVAEQIVQIYKKVEPDPSTNINILGKRGVFVAMPVSSSDRLHADNRDLEICVWLTRFIRNTLDWDKFVRALDERDRIESVYTAQNEADNQKLSNLHWAADRMPLKVYFHGSDKEGYNSELMEKFRKCVEYWSTASGTRIDYVVVEAGEHPDISLEWVGRGDNMYNIDFQDRTHVPKMKPFGTRLGQTWVEKCADDKKLIEHARIEIFADYDMIDDRLLSVLLHETGHAFGIRKHLRDPENIMYYALSDIKDAQKTKLTAADISTMQRLYGSEPICHGAVERFVGLPALCDRLTWTTAPLKIARASEKEKSAADKP